MNKITKQVKVSIDPNELWTMERIRNSVPKEVRGYQEKYCEKRQELFYRAVADVLNLIKEEWELYPKFGKVLCSFFLKNHRRATRIGRIFGITLSTQLPYGTSVDRDGKSIGGSLKSNPPRLFVRIMKEEAEKFERQYGCEFCAVDEDEVDYIYYDIPDNITILRPVLEFAYEKHRKD